MALSPSMISAMVECKICLETYHKPKHLNCGHTYCQDCLDDMLSFNEDGSAELNCPLRCPNKTIINEHDTTSSLANSYCLSEILDTVSKSGTSNGLCQQTENCKQPICYSCSTCGTKICEKCQHMHSCENKAYTTVRFNGKTGQLQPLCSQHNSLAKRVCIQCDNKFVCVFCVHREHKNHRLKSVTEFGMEAKNWFQSFITSFENTRKDSERLSKIYHETLMKLEREREIFAQELKMRKLKCIERYLTILNAEEERFLKEFDDKREMFRTEIINVNCMDHTSMKEYRDYINAFNLKSNFELIAEKVEIEKTLRNLTSLSASMPIFKSHLRQINDQELPNNPLGELKVFIDKVETDSLVLGTSSACQNLIKGSEKLTNFSQLAIKLSYIVESINGNRNVTNFVAENKTKSDATPTNAEPETYSDADNKRRNHPTCDTEASTTVRNLEDEPWYFGCITRDESIRYLKHPENKSGAFLIRKSENPSSGQLYVLSMLKGNFVQHFSIKRKFVLSKIQECNSLNELLHHCKSDWPLGEPCIKNPKSSLIGKFKTL
ncbi:uncharacterized protein LOC130639900 [Hydractinia symbiolongicarpus]|uniref:uncharacterized protein LOC130639900 n=1 Tax=Hydractinia symbiolongicarpus TaxID=13093 RepID=UPI00254DE483|nr:uncharacterized protein LOC130639900 [Hydractinia symbiolongicarpus]